MLDWALGGLGSLFGLVGAGVGAVTGWAWDKVTQGIYTWLANGLALLIEWVWGVLDTSSTPRVTADWFRNGLVGRVVALALMVTVAMMLASVIQAALAGRPEQIGDAVKEGARAVVLSAFTLTVIDVMVQIVDEASASVWQVGRADLASLVEGMVNVAVSSGPLGSTFVGPLCLFVGFVGLIGLTISLFMRSVLIYMAAGLAPLVWSSSVLPLLRGSGRRLVHLLVALIVSKLAIVVTLVVSVKLIANAGSDPDAPGAVNDGAAAVGTLLTGFTCFLVAAVSPVVLYKLMPTVEGAVASSGIAGGWTRGAMTVAQAGTLAAGAGGSAATRAVAGQAGVAGATGGSVPGATGGSGSQGSRMADTSLGSSTGSATGSEASEAAGGPGRGAEDSDRSGSPVSDPNVSTPAATNWDDAARNLQAPSAPVNAAGDDDEKEPEA